MPDPTISKVPSGRAPRPPSTSSRITPSASARSGWRSSAGSAGRMACRSSPTWRPNTTSRAFSPPASTLPSTARTSSWAARPRAIAGRKDLVRAAFLQNNGIGRGMKVGKESIAGAMAALEAWAQRDHAAVRGFERDHLELWLECLGRLPGLAVSMVPDPTDNPLDRLEVRVDPEQAGTTAWALAAALAAGQPPVIVRDHEVEHGRFYLDPCNLHPGEAEQVAEAVARTTRGHPRPTLAHRRGAAPCGRISDFGVGPTDDRTTFDRAHRQALRRHQRAAGRQLRRPCRRGAGAARRQRRRQVDADQDHCRRAAAEQRALVWRAGRSPSPVRPTPRPPASRRSIRTCPCAPTSTWSPISSWAVSWCAGSPA